MPITTYMDNVGGLDITASPIHLSDNQATGQSYNYEYATTGAISKVLSPSIINALGLANAQLKSLGLASLHQASTDSRTLVRYAGTKIQTVDLGSGVITDQTDDTSTAGSDFLVSGSTQPVVTAQFNTVNGTTLWAVGGGMATVEGFTGGTVTANGTPAPTGSIVPTVNTMAGGVFVAAGTYFYTVQFRKTSTQAYSNVSLDAGVTTVNTTDTVTIPLTTITNIDTTRFDQIRIWRSAVGGVTGFTSGSIIAELAITATAYTDTGTSILDTQVVPRTGNLIKDNSTLPAGTYKSISAFKRRLVTAKDSTIYLSDLDLPESWPLVNTITLPSGGPITGLSVIGVPSEYTTGADEYLCIFKDGELWVLTGSGPDDWALLFVDKTGCAGQSLIVPFNSFVAWLTYTGIYMWDGRGRPARVSRPLLSLFAEDGDLDKTRLSQGTSAFFAKSNQVIWRVSHRTLGPNQLSIKMDTRLTSLAAAQNLQNPEMDGVFIFDTDANPYYALCSFKLSSRNEKLIAGDDTGFVYDMYVASSPAVDFTYETKPLDMGSPEVMKRFKRVLVYLERLVPNDLSLFYWADYRNREEYKSVTRVSMVPARGTAPALWDVALWDQAFWDDYTPDISPVEYNLHAYENNAEGISLKLRFEQNEADAPVRIHGFAIEWEPVGNISIPNQQI